MISRALIIMLPLHKAREHNHWNAGKYFVVMQFSHTLSYITGAQWQMAVEDFGRPSLHPPHNSHLQNAEDKRNNGA